MGNCYEKLHGLQSQVGIRFVSYIPVLVSFEACKLSTFKLVLISANCQLPSFEKSKLIYLLLYLFSYGLSGFLIIDYQIPKLKRQGEGKKALQIKQNSPYQL